VAPLPFRTQEQEKEENDVRQLAQTSPKKEKKRKEKKGETVFEGNDISKVDNFTSAAGTKSSVGYHYSNESGACRQMIREQPSLRLIAETLTLPAPSALYQLALNDGRPSERLEGWQTIVESKEGPVTKYKHEQRTFLMRLSSEATESCIERSRGRGMYSQASSIIIITSNGGQVLQEHVTALLTSSRPEICTIYYVLYVRHHDISYGS
jgi:hypothetical protein